MAKKMRKMMMNNLIVKNVSFSYLENEKVLDDISFNLNSDDFLCVLGESGSGKTTLLKLIAGLLIPDEGNIIINEDNQNFVPAHKRKIGYVFQEPKLYTHLTVYENLMLGIKHIKLTFEEKDLLIKKLMKAFHLLSFMNIKPRYLSYGEQEKVALAKVFLVQEDLYLFDEAMSGLDTLSKKRTLNYINKIKKENHAPMIYVSHDEENIPSFTTKVLIFKNGKILFFNTLDEMYNHPTHIDILHYSDEKYNYLPIKTISNKLYYENIFINDFSLPDGEYILCLPTSNFYLVDKSDFILSVNKSYLDKNGNLILDGIFLNCRISILLPLEKEIDNKKKYLCFNFKVQKGFLFKKSGEYITSF